MQTEDIKEVTTDSKQAQLHSPQAPHAAQQLHPAEHEQPPQIETEYDLSELTISKDALEPIKFDGMAEVLKVLHSGVVKGIENAKLRESFVKAITLPRVGKVMRLSFYFILMSNFRECVKFEDEEEILRNLKKRLSKNYVKLFSAIPQPKDDIVNMIIFCMGYANHQLFYHIFPKQRELFDLRFVFNCYHILIFQFNGMFVSDFFVRMNIDKIFQQQKFLDYERVNRKAILQMQEAKSKVKAKTFFGFNLQFPDIASQEGQKFTKQMQDKFKPQKTSLHLQEDFLLDHISSQDKKDKIHSKLKDKRIKQIEESEWKKMLSMQNQQISENDRERAKTERERDSTDRERVSTDRDRIIRRQVVERAEQIFEKTALRTEQDGCFNKEDQNYFSNLQLNCNQISPTVSDLLAYESRTLPFEKKKLIRHAFETVNDKQDNLLSQLKQFSQNRKSSKETKLTQKVNKNMIDHFGLRPPPREYYQKHPKLDKLFKDMLDINYVLKCNRESMNQLPSSVQMHNEQANEQQQFILNQERDYNKQNQRQKVQENLKEVVEANQKYQLETRPGYRKKYIYTKPLQYMKKTQSMGQLPLESIMQNIQNDQIITSRLNQETNKISKKNEEKMEFQGMPSGNAILSTSKPTNAGSGQFFQFQNLVLREEKQYNGLNVEKSPQKLIDKVNQEFGGQQLSKDTYEDNTQQQSKMINPQKKEKLIKQRQLEPMSNRNLEFKVVEIDSQQNSKQAKRQNINEDNEYYKDNRRVYKQKYKGFIQGMNTDSNIDDILQDILHQRNQFNRGQQSKNKDTQ